MPATARQRVTWSFVQSSSLGAGATGNRSTPGGHQCTRHVVGGCVSAHLDDGFDQHLVLHPGRLCDLDANSSQPWSWTAQGTQGGECIQFGAARDSQTAADTSQLSGGVATGAATFSFIQVCILSIRLCLAYHVNVLPALSPWRREALVHGPHRHIALGLAPLSAAVHPIMSDRASAGH